MAANPAAVRPATPRPGRPAARGAPARAANDALAAETALVDRIRRGVLPWLGFGAAAAAIYVGWSGRETRRLFADQGLGYALGIIGSLLILVLLIYPLRKRVRVLRVLGPMKNWFRTHMTLGVVAPLAILYHCNFQTGSVNSTLALYSMLLVAGSGLVGRFLYSRIHQGLFGRRKHLKELIAGVQLSLADSGGEVRIVPGLMKAIARYDQEVLQPPGSIWGNAVLPLRLALTTRSGRRSILAATSLKLDLLAERSPAVAEHRDRLEAACARFVTEHLRRVRRVAVFAAYERLFSLWHKVHLPFFVLLVVTALVHVFAVHYYAT